MDGASQLVKVLVAALDQRERDLRERDQAPARRALTKTEAAESLGVSIDFLREHVLPELRVVRRGRRVIVPVAELDRWLKKHAARTVRELGEPSTEDGQPIGGPA